MNTKKKNVPLTMNGKQAGTVNIAMKSDGAYEFSDVRIHDSEASQRLFTIDTCLSEGEQLLSLLNRIADEMAREDPEIQKTIASTQKKIAEAGD